MADIQVQFTTSFEARVIDALQDSKSISVVAERMGVSSDEESLEVDRLDEEVGGCFSIRLIDHQDLTGLSNAGNCEA